MKDIKNGLKNINKNEDKIIEINVIKEEEIEKKENNIISSNSIKTSKDKSKENKTNIQNKNLDIEKLKNLGKANLNENNNQRINNFINYSNSNLHNRYYSSNTSNHIFRNFIKKANYNKDRDNFISTNNISNYYGNDIPFNDNRTSSFTSRINNNIYINKGLNYILGNNPNNINQKDLIDYRKRQGFDYKKNKKGKRNNYMNKKIFFSLNEGQNKQEYPVNSTNLYNNYPQNTSLLNNYKNINELSINNRNNMTSSKQKFLHMNDFLFLDNLEMKIINIRNNLLNFLENNINNNISENNYYITSNELNAFPGPLKIMNPGAIDYYNNNSNNIAFNSINFNMNMNNMGNPYFG